MLVYYIVDLAYQLHFYFASDIQLAILSALFIVISHHINVCIDIIQRIASWLSLAKCKIEMCWDPPTCRLVHVQAQAWTVEIVG